ncbi:DNA-processing protein DprA [Janibacter sp. GXQ6167]|uniref:DNA-processing protein DprA n=1 Tax=Janibacter sp. GXQ6167 TaxID=3240791 RepID=UPI003525F829
MTASTGSVSAAVMARARDMVKADERRARIAWSRVAEPASPAVQSAVSSHGYVGAWHRLIDGRLTAVRGPRERIGLVDVDRDIANTMRVGARIIIPGDAEWPAQIGRLPEPPHALWVRGEQRLDEVSARSVALVGSRASTGYGESVAQEIAADLTSRGWTVVSGAAYGIDAAAHRGALAVDGATIAVLPCGIDRCYPMAHRELVGAVARSGGIVSELPPGSVAMRQRFLSRNRLIAAFTAATIVVEAARRSGALNTAGHAERIGAPVGAVSGPVTSMASSGCHQWIREQRAVLVTDAVEVIDLAGDIGADAAGTDDLDRRLAVDHLSVAARAVHDALLVRRGTTVAAVAVTTALAPDEVLAELVSLELEGWAAREPDGTWRRLMRR